MNAGPGRHLQSSSRCHRVSTRSTGAPQSWQGGEASAISSALVIAARSRGALDRPRTDRPRISCDSPPRRLGNPCVPGPRASSSIGVCPLVTRGVGTARRAGNGPFVQRTLQTASPLPDSNRGPVVAPGHAARSAPGCVPAAFRFSPAVRAAQPPPIGIVMTTRSASTGRLRTGPLECTPSSSTTAI
jgi:hypothetical protein